MPGVHAVESCRLRKVTFADTLCSFITSFPQAIMYCAITVTIRYIGHSLEINLSHNLKAMRLQVPTRKDSQVGHYLTSGWMLSKAAAAVRSHRSMRRSLKSALLPRKQYSDWSVNATCCFTSKLNCDSAVVGSSAVITACSCLFSQYASDHAQSSTSMAFVICNNLSAISAQYSEADVHTSSSSPTKQISTPMVMKSCAPSNDAFHYSPGSLPHSSCCIFTNSWAVGCKLLSS